MPVFRVHVEDAGGCHAVPIEAETPARAAEIARSGHPNRRIGKIKLDRQSAEPLRPVGKAARRRASAAPALADPLPATRTLRGIA